MGIFSVDMTKELDQVEATLNRVVNKTVKPVLDEAIDRSGAHLHSVVENAGAQLSENIKQLSAEIHDQRRMTKEELEVLIESATAKLGANMSVVVADAGTQLNSVVANAGERLNESIKQLSAEVHDHRRITKDDIFELIDYATARMGETLDQRISTLKTETSNLITEKTQMLKLELEDAAIRSRKTIYTNVAASVGGAILVALLSLVYKKVSLGQIDMLVVFRICLVSLAVGSGISSVLKMAQRWKEMNQAKKGITTVMIGYLGVLRPNGAMALFGLSVALLLGWGWLLHIA